MVLGDFKEVIALSFSPFTPIWWREENKFMAKSEWSLIGPTVKTGWVDIIILVRLVLFRGRHSIFGSTCIIIIIHHVTFTLAFMYTNNELELSYLLTELIKKSWPLPTTDAIRLRTGKMFHHFYIIWFILRWDKRMTTSFITMETGRWEILTTNPILLWRTKLMLGQLASGKYSYVWNTFSGFLEQFTYRNYQWKVINKLVKLCYLMTLISGFPNKNIKNVSCMFKIIVKSILRLKIGLNHCPPFKWGPMCAKTSHPYIGLIRPLPRSIPISNKSFWS